MTRILLLEQVDNNKLECVHDEDWVPAVGDCMEHYHKFLGFFGICCCRFFTSSFRYILTASNRNTDPVTRYS